MRLLTALLLPGGHRSAVGARLVAIDGVRSGDLVSVLLRRIAAKLGLSDTRRLRLLHAGKQLEPTAACGLSKGDTVHLVGSLDGGAPTLRRRQVGSASGAALPDAPCVSFYQGDAHGGSRVAELAWHASMHPDRAAFADAWVSTAERAAMPPHLGVILWWQWPHPRMEWT